MGAYPTHLEPHQQILGFDLVTGVAWRPLESWFDARPDLVTGRERIASRRIQICIVPRPGQVIATNIRLSDAATQSDLLEALDAAQQILKEHRALASGTMTIAVGDR